MIRNPVNGVWVKKFLWIVVGVWVTVPLPLMVGVVVGFGPSAPVDAGGNTASSKGTIGHSCLVTSRIDLWSSRDSSSLVCWSAVDAVVSESMLVIFGCYL